MVLLLIKNNALIGPLWLESSFSFDKNIITFKLSDEKGLCNWCRTFWDGSPLLVFQIVERGYGDPRDCLLREARRLGRTVELFLENWDR